MDTRTQQISDQEIDSIGQIIEDKMNANARFVDDRKIDENDLSEFDYQISRPSASFITNIDYNVKFYIDTHPGAFNDDNFPLLTANAAQDLQHIKAANLRNRYETTDAIKEFVKSGSSKRQIADIHVARNQYSCTSCNGIGNYTCSNCSGHGNNTCYKCSFGTISCFHCGGTGRSNPSQSRHVSPCALCVGTGRRTCTDCNGTTKIRCGVCKGSGDVGCVSCENSGVLTDFYGVKYTAEFKHNMANSTFKEDELVPLYDWMHGGLSIQGAKGDISPSISMQRIITDAKPTIESARHLLSIKIDAMKMTLQGSHKTKNIQAKYVMFDKPWVWYNSYLDEEISKIAEKAARLSTSSPSDFLREMSKHPALNEALRHGWDREDSNGEKWAKNVHQDSLGAISKEVARPIFMAFRDCMQNHERSAIRSAYKLPITATLLLWILSQYMNIPLANVYGATGVIINSIYVLTPYFITRKIIEWSVRKRVRNETGADQKTKLGFAGRVIPIISSSIFAATWYFGFHLSNVMIAGRPLF